MDFNDYINNLNDLDNQENRTELKTFYTLNSTTIKFFKTIDKAILDLLACPNISGVAVKQLEGILPVLTKLKRELIILDKDILSDSKISSLVDYIKNSMPVSEVEIVFLEFHNLCNEKKDALIEQENKRREEEERLKQAEIIQQARERKQQKELENTKKYKITFEYQDSFMCSVASPIAVFIDDYHFVNIDKKQTYEGVILEGSHRIKFTYIVNVGIFSTLKNRTIQFDINLQSNIRVFLKISGKNWNENTLVYYYICE